MERSHSVFLRYYQLQYFKSSSQGRFIVMKSFLFLQTFFFHFASYALHACICACALSDTIFREFSRSTNVLLAWHRSTVHSLLKFVLYSTCFVFVHLGNKIEFKLVENVVLVSAKTPTKYILKCLE